MLFAEFRSVSVFVLGVMLGVSVGKGGGGGGFAAFPGVLCISTLAYFFFCLFVFLLDTIR